MNMRKIVILSIGIFLFGQAFAQNGRYASLDDFPEVKNSTLLVVLYEEDDLYNDNIKEIIETHWKFTPYQFVDTAELYDITKGKDDKEYSMLVRNNGLRLVNRVNGTDRIQSNHLALYLLDKGSDMRNYTGKDALTQFQMKDVRNTFEYFHKLPAFIKYMQLYLHFVEEKKPTEDNHVKLLKAFNSANTQKLTDYTVLVEEDYVKDNLEIEDLSEAYTYPIEIVEQVRILSAVKNEEEKTAFLHLDPRIKQITVMDAASGEILYLARTETSGELSATDFKKMRKAASGEVSKKGNLLKGKFSMPKKLKKKLTLNVRQF